MKKEMIIRENDAGQRLDKYLVKTFPSLPPAFLYKAIRKKDVKRNGKRCEGSDRLLKDDLIALFLPDEFFAEKPHPYAFMKAPQKLDILYEDDHLLLLDKKPGLIVHPDDQYHFDSLIARVQRYLYEKGAYRPEDEASFAPALINRIDRNTGGIVMAAKTAEALRIMNEKVKQRELQKLYLCIVHGRMPKQEDTLTGYLEKNEKQNRVYVSHKPANDTKTIRTHYRVLKEHGAYSLLEVDLLTGRTHQIRAHLASVGHPIAGDGKYGINAQNKSCGFPYQALYSYKLRFSFTTPSGSLEYLNGREFEAPRIWFLSKFDKLFENPLYKE